ncbi:hypothetical protein ACEN40_06280 [Campylobacter bilis]|uniref:hypothetical protein n=1 Tax=Campylobacter bilis TaxID=2691918 RepID=UPI003593FC8E
MFFIKKNLLLMHIRMFLSAIKYLYMDIFDIYVKRFISQALCFYKNQQNKKISQKFIEKNTIIKNFSSYEKKTFLMFDKLKFFIKTCFAFFSRLNSQIFKGRKYDIILTFFVFFNHLAYKNHLIKG